MTPLILSYFASHPTPSTMDNQHITIDLMNTLLGARFVTKPNEAPVVKIA